MQSFVSVIGNVPTIVVLEITQLDDQVYFRFILKLITIILRVLQNLLTYLNGTAILTFSLFHVII